MRKTLRQHFAPIIARVLAEYAGRPWREIGPALRAAFPMGIRRYWPYKVWLSEIRRQRQGGKAMDQEPTPLFDAIDETCVLG